jgi:hypothetical protein
MLNKQYEKVNYSMYKFWVRRYKFCQFHFFITFGKILTMKKIFIKLAFLGVLAPSLYYAQTSEISPQQEKKSSSKAIQRGGQCRNRNPKISKTGPKRKQKHHLTGGRKLVYLVFEI